MFNMTIKENIMFGNPDASEEEIAKALESANAWTFVNQMTEKLDT